MSQFSETDLWMIALVLDEEEEQQVRKRKWVLEDRRKRDTEGEFVTLFKELKDNEAKFHKYFGMSENAFNILLSKLEVKLRKRDTHWRKAIEPKERLAVCLRYLVAGGALNTISHSYRMGHSTVHKIVRETCKVITENLMEELLPTPTAEMWKNIANDFYEIWNFPNCIGALGGKYVAFQAPPNSPDNYQSTSSIVLLALVDAHCNFIAVDVGPYGKYSDGGIFANSNFGKAFQQRSLNVPEPSVIPDTNIRTPYVVVCDEAFPLKEYMMRPYPGKSLDDCKQNFNYRLNRARTTSENAFAMLSQKFHIYNRSIHACPENVDKVILATCLLHNFVQKYDSNRYNYNMQNVQSRKGGGTLQKLDLQGGNATSHAFQVRELFTEYFNSEKGSLPEASHS